MLSLFFSAEKSLLTDRSVITVPTRDISMAIKQIIPTTIDKTPKMPVANAPPISWIAPDMLSSPPDTSVFSSTAPNIKNNIASTKYANELNASIIPDDRIFGLDFE